MEFFDKSEHILDRKKEDTSFHPLHTALVFGLKYLESSEKPD